ncbi:MULTISPECIES: hypothetical protein [unclassified Kitasatospora]|uniref:hypothetical protein n=1 Tax=unclassified Kitasatospora TaxID=2633591 RepID=UPI00382F2200
MMGYVLILAAMALLVVGGLDFDREEREPGCLWWVRVLPHRTIEIRRRGRFGLDVGIYDQR